MQYTEKDMEDWLWEHPSDLHSPGWVVDHWAGRQISLRTGRIDLVGVVASACSTHRWPIVVELKNSEITADALTQVMRYETALVQDLEMEHANEFFHDDNPPHFPQVLRAVVGSGWPTQSAFYDASVLGIFIFKFTAGNFKASIAEVEWREGANKEKIYDEVKYKEFVNGLHKDIYHFENRP